MGLLPLLVATQPVTKTVDLAMDLVRLTHPINVKGTLFRDRIFPVMLTLEGWGQQIDYRLSIVPNAFKTPTKNRK